MVAAAVMTPAVGLTAAAVVWVAVVPWVGPVEKTVSAGVCRLVWLRTLKNSARNWVRRRSVSWVVLSEGEVPVGVAGAGEGVAAEVADGAVGGGGEGGGVEVLGDALGGACPGCRAGR